MKNLSLVFALSVFLVACGEQNAERPQVAAEQADVMPEEQNIEMAEPEVLEAENLTLENNATISGDITYDGQAVLPENAMLYIFLLDTSKPEENGFTPLSTESYLLEGPPPYSYELKFENSLINEEGKYRLWAAIRIGKEPIFRGGSKLDLFPDADVTLSLNLRDLRED